MMPLTFSAFLNCKKSSVILLLFSSIPNLITSETQCGLVKKPINRVHRLVGGARASNYGWPWIVQVGEVLDDKSGIVCLPIK